MVDGIVSCCCFSVDAAAAFTPQCHFIRSIAAVTAAACAAASAAADTPRCPLLQLLLPQWVLVAVMGSLNPPRGSHLW